MSGGWKIIEGLKENPLEVVNRLNNSDLGKNVA